MKKFNWLFATVLLACVGLVWASSNHNFAANKQEYAHKKINNILSPSDCGGEEVDKLVDSIIIAPVSEIIKKHNPHFFMTKCFNQVRFKGNHDENDKLKNIKIVEGVSYLRGNLEISFCSNETPIAEVLLHCESKTVLFKMLYDKADNKKDKFIDKATFFSDFEKAYKKEQH